MLVYNASKLTQVVDVPGSAFPIAVNPGGIIIKENYKSVNMEYFKPFEINEIYNQKSFCVVRRYALGDIIQLIPVMRVLKAKANMTKISIATSYEYYPLSKMFPEISFLTEDSLRDTSNRHGLIYTLDGCLEKDHSLDNKENHLHRVQIYASVLGLDINSKWDWFPTYRFNYIPEFNMETKYRYIGLQIRGSGKMKTLHPDVIKMIATKLAEKYKVVLLDGNKDVGFEGKNIINTCGKLGIYQCTALLNKLDACITMDSGMLWMAHIANCPVLTILGPTREQERISLHPQYPKKAKAISISEDIIGCKPCFETREYCKGKINCMNNYDRNTLVKMIETKIEEILGE